jgi:beta-barrel assembly-enhancing protease
MKKILIAAAAAIFALTGCNKEKKFNLFTVNQDIEFGQQLHAEIIANTGEYPLLETSHPAHIYVDEMLTDILGSTEILYKEFPWQVRVIDKDVMNAFAAPGGYLYFYKGLITYLENGAAVAGVMAHEVAHSDRRHSTQTMTKVYGLQMMLDVVLGKEGNMGKVILKDMALGFSSLKFSREHEYEADGYAVKYLKESKIGYNPLGIRVFFDQLERDGYTNKNFEFLSTHPTDENRIENIVKVHESIGEPKGNDFADKHQQIVKSLQ